MDNIDKYGVVANITDFIYCLKSNLPKNLINYVKNECRNVKNHHVLMDVRTFYLQLQSCYAFYIFLNYIIQSLKSI